MKTRRLPFVPCLSLLTLLSVSHAESVKEWRYGFGEEVPNGDWVRVTPASYYSEHQQFGFEAGSEITYGLEDQTKKNGATYVTSTKPFLFSVRVPEGNYRVVVRIGGGDSQATTTIKAESRRLMIEAVSTQAGETKDVEFVVNVRNSTLPAPPANAPGADTVRLNDREVGHLNWDDKLTLEFCGDTPRIAAVEISKVELPTIYLAGDSTVTDQRWEPGASWGQMLPRFFGASVAISNHAESGETLKSFLTALRFDKILSSLKAGDYVFLQFGHNDSKSQWPQTYAAANTTYRAYLKAYIAEIRRRGATPVLITSMHRRNFDANGKIVNTHGDYPAAVRDVAREEGLTLIDLHAMSAKLYESLGPEKSPLAFSAGGKDVTHHNNYGAYQLARCVVEGIRQSDLPLKRDLAETPRFDPSAPDAPETFRLPPSAQKSDLVPRGS